LASLGIAGLFDPRWRRVAIVGFALLIVTVALGLPADIETFGFLENLRYFTVFFGAGVLAYFIRAQLPIAPVMLLPLAVLFVAFVKTPLAELISALFLGYASLCAATLQFGPLRPVCNRFDLSFGVYIYAGPTQQALIWLLPGLTPLWLTVLAFLIVAPIALVSWVLIEKPALGLKRAIATRSTKAAALQPAS
jgi:peptidoglycan/LPS O-acetylase OafA/YrhL